MRGISPGYLTKLDEAQQKFIFTVGGRKFWDHFVTQKGYHCFIIGNTGSGKTQKGYWLVNWLKHTETQIWISTGKNDEILPLFCMGKKIRIICPKGCSINFKIWDEIQNEYRLIDDYPEIITVGSPSEAWDMVKGPSYLDGHHKFYDTINIFEFRNSFWSKKNLSYWMSGLFESLATRTRLKQMPKIFPCTIYADETQWILAGTRVSTDSHRTKSSEVVTENALEIRSAGGRLVFFAQDYKNITPASRENMLCSILCRGAMIDRTENPALAYHCVFRHGRLPSNFKAKEGKFIYADGSCYPYFVPWPFPLFPKDESDRNWISKVKLSYEGYHDQQPKEAEYQEECQPELGRFSAMAIPPENQDEIISRWSSEGIGVDDGV